MDREEKRPQAAVSTVDAAGKVPFKDEIEVKGIKGFFFGQKPILKNALMIVFLNVVFSLFGLIAMAMEGSKLWLGVLLYILFLGADFMLVFLMGKSGAYAAFNTYRLNSVNQRNGRHVPYYKRMQEYRFWKGYLTGVVGSLPLILLVVIAALLPSGVLAPAGVGIYAAIVKAAYSLFFTPFAWIDPGIHIGVMLIGALINAVSFGLGYHVFGMKMTIQQEMIESDMRRLHSENFSGDGSNETDV